MQYQLRIAGKFYKQLQQHLFPGDGKEAVAVALCGRYEKDGLSILLTHKLELIPHEECERDDDFIRWKTERIVPLLEEAAMTGMALLKIHSHPGGYAKFSNVDDFSDNEFFSSVFGWCDSDSVHGSAIMLPSGQVFGRVFDPDLTHYAFNKVSVAGDTIDIWQSRKEFEFEEHSIRTKQAFGEGTYNKLKQLKVGVIGCSGTGSPTIEQLARLGVGELVLIDPDATEHKNLNRILNTTKKDADQKRLKTGVLADAINAMGFGTKVKCFSIDLFNSIEALNELITCDILVGCVDTVDCRYLIGELGNFYLIPYFDLGVRLDADGNGGIESIYASIHYIQPGCSNLRSRGLYTPERLSAEMLKRYAPSEFERLLKQGYVRNANVDRPAVISINMQISSMAVNEILNRLHPFKHYPPEQFAKVTMDYCDGCVINDSESDFEEDIHSAKWCGRGHCSPFLSMNIFG